MDVAVDWRTLGWEPGHFYSPIPSLPEVRARASRLFVTPRTLPDVELDEAHQLEVLDAIAAHAPELPFADEPRDGLRYGLRNDYFSYGEAVVLFGMMLRLRPRRIIEVGSGHSSAAILDIADRFLGGDVECTFIEPYPERLLGLLRSEDLARVRLVRERVQDVDVARFDALDAGDMLVVDSTHVTKIGSDVNHLVFNVLPRLREGVVIHFHDIYYPFEYPQRWLEQGRYWNEAYLVRAFLQGNRDVRIEFFNDFLAAFHADRLAAALPPFMRAPGSSLWLSRRAAPRAEPPALG